VPSLQLFRTRRMPSPVQILVVLIGSCAVLSSLFGCGGGDEDKNIPNAKPLDPALAKKYGDGLRRMGPVGGTHMGVRR
jgi:hypothetical protein